ncbi:endonuclease domain-containing protein [Agrococcus baldri]|uniref:DUF559 domain-containing protein n=1 Tax=Agrococcus baldri TaxID=153730 RepID=A0AA87RE35_9MICO|nr:DUF559 domain-containing protein [Agrococcus baldri]GEK81380.1 hypothetical protein ABA31_27310 [Agrococcus baldri]
MRDIAVDLAAAGGAATRTALRALGHTSRQIGAAIARGEAQAVGRSWVMPPEADASIKAALEAGGVLGGASALRSYGVWVTDDPGLQIATQPTRGAAAVSVGVRIWERFEPDARPWRVSIVDALAQHARRVAREHAIASIDSALHHGLIAEHDLDRLFAMLPARCATWRRLLDPQAGSGLESLVRVACLDRGWRVESQVPAPGGGFSDLLIDGWLYVEADGDEWHDNEKQAGKDRRRNRAITDKGDRWLRFGYAEIVHDRDRTIETIALVLAQGRPGLRRAS